MLLCATVNRFSRGTGSQSVAVPEFVMRNGKIVGLSAQITGNMCLAMNVQKQIPTKTPGLMSPLQFGITSVLATWMSVTGSLSNSAKYHQAPGQCMARKTLHSGHYHKQVTTAPVALSAIRERALFNLNPEICESSSWSCGRRRYALARPCEV